MKKILSFVILVILSSALRAQEEVTRFLGIPVDGSKNAMIEKLKTKGFTSSPLDKNVLVGKFNGTDVNIHVVTNGDKVYRIAVFDVNSINEVDIKIRFNMLCRQFQSNKKYLPASLLSPDYTLSDDENIGYGISLKKKRYEADYYQLSAVVDTVAIEKEMKLAILSKYTEDELSNPTEELKKEMLSTALSYMLEKNSKRSVWFMIEQRSYDKYYIALFYDNKNNIANGEDL